MVMESPKVTSSTSVSVSVTVKKGADDYRMSVEGKNPKAVIKAIRTMVEDLLAEDTIPGITSLSQIR